MKQLKKLVPFIILLVLFVDSVYSFPPFIPMEERYEQSQVVLAGEIVKIRTQKMTSTSSIVNIRVRVAEVVKGKYKRKFLNLTFLAFPNTVENHLIRPPEKGFHIFFLAEKTVTDSKGRKGKTLVCYEPRVFALMKHTEGNLKKLRSFKK